MNQDEIDEKELRKEVEVKQSKVRALESEFERIALYYGGYNVNTDEYLFAIDLLIRLDEAIRINKRLLSFDKKKLESLITKNAKQSSQSSSSNP